MNKRTDSLCSDFEKFENIKTKIKVSMFLKDENIKTIDEDGFEDTKKIYLEKNAEFGICNLDKNTEISFEFGSIKIDKRKFNQALNRFIKRNEFIKNLE